MTVPGISFEVFPPRDEHAQRTLAGNLAALAAFRPLFVSVTDGAGGSARAPTTDWAERVAGLTHVPVVPHLAGAGSTRASVVSVARRYWSAGFRHLVALRGDRPAEGEDGRGSDDGFSNATELVATLRTIADFELSVAAYPERHPDSGSWAEELVHLKAKCDAGAARLITQFCFEPDAVLRFRDRCDAAGIQLPLAVGVLPIQSLPQVRRFAARCGAVVPGWLSDRFANSGDDPAARQDVAAAVATEFASRLLGEGIQHLHFYTLNRAEPTATVCAALGIS